MMAAVSNRDGGRLRPRFAFAASEWLIREFKQSSRRRCSKCYERYKYEGYESYLGNSHLQMLEPTWDRFAKV